VSARPVAVVDYGRGNLFSVCQAVARVGGTPYLATDPAAVRSAERLILPGVGAFGDAMAGLRHRGLADAIRDFAATGRPLLGLCLGMQLLLDESSEFGRHEGLHLIPGRVERLPQPPRGGRDKIPNVGWCRLEPAAGGAAWAESILAGVKPGDFAYFVHSYAAHPTEPRHRLADITFGGAQVAAAVAAGPIAGCQFHPEKSGEVGLAILDAFLTRTWT
jgi:glutamine amidotransferase